LADSRRKAKRISKARRPVHRAPFRQAAGNDDANACRNGWVTRDLYKESNVVEDKLVQFIDGPAPAPVVKKNLLITLVDLETGESRAAKATSVKALHRALDALAASLGEQQ
jgi:hypothetical protein